MTVRQMIEKLSKLNPDLEVFVDGAGSMGSSQTGWMEGEDEEAEVYDLETRVKIGSK